MSEVVCVGQARAADVAAAEARLLVEEAWVAQCVAGEGALCAAGRFS